MRDSKRIDRIVEKLRAYWTACPDLRLGQIVVNASGRSDPFYVEDDDMEAKIDDAMCQAPSSYRLPVAIGVEVVAPADVRLGEPRRYYHRNDIDEVRDAESMDCLDGPAHLQPLTLRPGGNEADWFAVVAKRRDVTTPTDVEKAIAVVAGEAAWMLATECSTPMEAAVLIQSLRNASEEGRKP